MADLTKEFVEYIVALKAANVTAKDVNTLIIKDLPTIIALEPTQVDDLNTLYLTALD